jgi:hypothetical protein
MSLFVNIAWLFVGAIGDMLFDFLSVSQSGGSNVAAIMSAGVMIGAVLIVILFKPANLSRKHKQRASF